MTMFTEVYTPSLPAGVLPLPSAEMTLTPLALGDEPLLVSADGTQLYVSEEGPSGPTPAQDTALRDEIDRRFRRLTPEELLRLQLLLPRHTATVLYDRDKRGPAPTERAQNVIREAEQACFALPDAPTMDSPVRRMFSVLSRDTVARVARLDPRARATMRAVQSPEVMPPARTQPERMFEHIRYYFDPDNRYDLGTVAVGCAIVYGRQEYYLLTRWGPRLESFETAAKRHAVQGRTVRRVRIVAAPLAAVAIVGIPTWLMGSWWFDTITGQPAYARSDDVGHVVLLAAGLLPYVVLLIIALAVMSTIWPDSDDH